MNDESISFVCFWFLFVKSGLYFVMVKALIFIFFFHIINYNEYMTSIKFFYKY